MIGDEVRTSGCSRGVLSDGGACVRTAAPVSTKEQSRSLGRIAGHLTCHTGWKNHYVCLFVCLIYQNNRYSLINMSLLSCFFLVPTGHCHGIFVGRSRASDRTGIEFLDCETGYENPTN